LEESWRPAGGVFDATTGIGAVLLVVVAAALAEVVGALGAIDVLARADVPAPLAAAVGIEVSAQAHTAMRAERRTHGSVPGGLRRDAGRRRR
jgi:hypothetical protein